MTRPPRLPTLRMTAWFVPAVKAADMQTAERIPQAGDPDATVCRPLGTWQFPCYTRCCVAKRDTELRIGVETIRKLLDRFYKVAVARLRLVFRANVTRHEKVFAPRYGVRNLRDPVHGSYSGPGSTVERTNAIRDALPDLIRRMDCKSIIDAPCGDFKWMQHIELPVESYLGVDVVKDLIDLNAKRYSTAQRRFQHFDLVEQVLPPADLVLNRDMLIHLSFDDIFKFIKLLKRSGCVYLLTSHFPEQAKNWDICTGSWRPVNLQIPPFNWPTPVLTISEKYTANPNYADKCLALWKVDDIPRPGDCA